MSFSELPIGKCCNLINGRAFKPSDWTQSGLPIVRIQNLNDASKPFNYYDGEVRSRFLIDSGELLFSWSGTPGTSFGAFFWNRGKAVLNQHIFRVELDESSVDANYFRYALNSKLDGIIAQAHGGVGLKHITKGKLEATRVPLPPLRKQKRIAAILDAADALRAKRRESLAQLDTLLQSTFLEMFGDPGTSESTSLEDICELITDGTHQTPTYASEGVTFLSSKNVKTGEINWQDIKFIPESLHKELHKRLSPQRDDILLAKNGTTGIAAIVDRDDVFDIYVSLALLRPTNAVLPVYLLHAINSDHSGFQFKRSLKGVGVPNLHLKEIRKTRIPLPPLSLQHRFATIVESIEQQKAHYRAHLTELDTLFASLQARAFNGEL